MALVPYTLLDSTLPKDQLNETKQSKKTKEKIINTKQMNFKYSQSANGSGRQGDYQNLQFVGNKISLIQQTRQHPPEDYPVQPFYSNSSNLYHPHTEDTNRQQGQHIYMVKRDSGIDNREQLSKSSSSDSFYVTEKTSFRVNHPYQMSNPVNFNVSANGPFFSEKEIPKVTVLSRQPSETNINQNIQIITSPTNVKYTQQAQRSPQYVQILHHPPMSPMRQQKGRVIKFSPGKMVSTPESGSVNHGNVETSRAKQGMQQTELQNRNHVSMFSISSIVAGSDVSNSRVQHGNDQYQLASNKTHANSMTANITSANSYQTAPTQYINSQISANIKPSQTSASREQVSQTPNSSSQITYGSSMHSNKPSTNRSINNQGYNYTLLLSKPTISQSNNPSSIINGSPLSNNTSATQGLTFQERSLNKLHKQSTINYKMQVNASGGSGVNSSNQSGQVTIKRKSSEMQKPVNFTKTSDEFGIDFKPNNPSFSNTITSPKYSKHTELQQTESMQQKRYTSTTYDDFTSQAKRFASTSNGYELKEYDREERKHNLKEIIKNESIVDKLEGKVNSYETEILSKNEEINRLKKDSSEKVLEIISLNQELEKYKSYEKTLNFKEREAKSLSFHQSHSDYSSSILAQEQACTKANSSSQRSVEQGSHGIIAQTPRSSKPNHEKLSHQTFTQQLSNVQYIQSRGSKSIPTAENYNHVQNLNEKLLEHIQKMEKQFKPLRDEVKALREMREKEREWQEERARLGKEVSYWKANFSRVEVSNTEIDRTMKLILAQKMNLQKQKPTLQKQLQELQNKLKSARSQSAAFQSTRFQLQLKAKQLQQKNNQLSNELVSKQEYIFFLSQENSSLSEKNQKSSHKLLVQIEDHKDTINVLKKLNEKQKHMIEGEKDKLRDKDATIAELNQQIAGFTEETRQFMLQIDAKKHAIKNKEQIISQADAKLKEAETKIKENASKQSELIGREKESLLREKILEQKLSQLQASASNDSKISEELFKVKQTNNQLLVNKRSQQLYLKQFKEDNSKQVQELTLKAKEILQLKQQNKLIDQQSAQKQHQNEQLLTEVKSLTEQNHSLRDQITTCLQKNKLSASNSAEELRKFKDQNISLKKQINTYAGETNLLKQQLQKQKYNNLALIDNLNTARHQNNKHQTAYKVWQKELTQLNQQISHEKDQVTKLKGEIAYLRVKNTQLTEKNNKITNEHQELANNWEKLTEQYRQFNDGKSFSDNNCRQLTQKCNELTNNLNQVTDQLNTTNTTTSRQEKEISQLKKTNISLTSSINHIKDSLNTAKYSQTQQHAQKAHLVEKYTEEVTPMTRLLEKKNQEIEETRQRILQITQKHAFAFQSKDQQIKQLERQVSQLHSNLQKLNGVKSSNDSNLENIKILEQELNKLQEEKVQLNYQINQLKSEKQVYTNKLTLQIRDLKAEYERRLSEDSDSIQKSYHQELEAKNQTIAKIQKQLIAIKEKLQTSQLAQNNQQKSTNTKIQQLHKQNELITKKNSHLVKQNETLAKKNAQLLNQTETLNKKATSLQQEINKLYNTINSNKKLEQPIKKEEKTANVKKAQTVNQLTASIQQKINQITTLKKELSKQQESHKDLLKQVQSLKDSADQIQSQNINLENQAETLTELNSKLKIDLDRKQLTIKELSAKTEELEIQVSDSETRKENQLTSLHEAISELKQQLVLYEQKNQLQLTANQKLQAIQVQQTTASQIIDQSLQDDKPLSPSTTQIKMSQPELQPQHFQEELASEQFHQIMASLKQQAQELKHKQSQLKEKEQQLSDKEQQLSDKEQQLSDKEQQLSDKEQQLSDKEDEVTQKQQLLEDRAQQIQEKQLEVQELYNQVKQQIQQLRNQFSDLNQIQSDESISNPNQIQSDNGIQQQGQNDFPTHSQPQEHSGLNLNNLQSNQQEEIEFIEIDKNALIYICELLSIPLIEGQLLTSIISKVETIATQISSQDKVSQTNAKKSPKSMTTSILKSNRNKPHNKQLAKIVTDFEALHESFVVPSDDESNGEQNLTKTSPKSNKKLTSPKNSCKHPQRDRAMSKQCNSDAQDQLLSSRSLESIKQDQSAYINSSQLFNKSQIFSQKLIPQLQQEYIEILELFEVSAQKPNHHQLLINQIVSIKESIKMLLEEVRKVENDKEKLERELKDERKRVGVIIQESGKEIVKVTKDLAKLQQEKDNISLVNSKLQQEILFITHELIALRISSMVYLNPEKYQEEVTEQISQPTKILKFQDLQVQNLSNFAGQIEQVAEKTEKQTPGKKKRKNSENSANKTAVLQLPKLKTKYKSHKELSQLSQESYQSNDDLKPSSVKNSPLNKMKGGQKAFKIQDFSYEQQNLEKTHSMEEEIAIISEINTQELHIYTKINKKEDIIQENQQILNQFSENTQTEQQQASDSLQERQDQKDEQWYELDENDL